MLIEEALRAFQTLKKACLETPMLAIFTNFNKPYLLETVCKEARAGGCAIAEADR